MLDFPQLRKTVAVLAIVLWFPWSSFAQLQITEFLYDTRSSEPAWEWFEVHNASQAEIDLDGYIFDDRSTSTGRTSPNIVAMVGDVAVNTVIPPGQTAVLYNGGALDFEESRFRTAWGLGSHVPLVGVNGWQSLNNDVDGDAFGLWDSLEAYELDLDNVDGDADVEVSSFDSAVAWLDYGAEGFPRSGAGNSLQWSGNGDLHEGENWRASDADTARTSIATTLEGLAINDTRDIGNPGIVVGFPDGFDALAITEIMYNPASDEPGWEWVELYNGSDASIDFASTPYFLDDRSGDDLSEPNVNTGSLGPGQTAILIPSATSADDMQTAWGENNYIPVTAWPSLNNGGDLVGIWSDAEEYAFDGELAGDRLADGAVFSIAYLVGDEDWPNTGQGTSISILDLADDVNAGANWAVSFDGDDHSFFANAVIASQSDHDGGDVGTPGLFGEAAPSGLDLDGNGTVNADDAALLCNVVGDGSVADFLSVHGAFVGDFDFNQAVEFADFLKLSANFGQTENVHYGSGDADCQNGVNFADFPYFVIKFRLGFRRDSGRAGAFGFRHSRHVHGCRLDSSSTTASHFASWVKANESLFGSVIWPHARQVDGHYALATLTCR